MSWVASLSWVGVQDSSLNRTYWTRIWSKGGFEVGKGGQSRRLGSTGRDGEKGRVFNREG